MLRQDGGAGQTANRQNVNAIAPLEIPTTSQQQNQNQQLLSTNRNNLTNSLVSSGPLSQIQEASQKPAVGVSQRSNQRQVNLEIERRHAIFNPDTRLKDDEERMKLLPKKGVSRHLSHILKPINEKLGGQPVQKTIYTTNGFNKVKFDHDCFEK